MQKLKSSNSRSTQNFVVSFVYIFMDELPEIVDGARNISQRGRCILVGTRDKPLGFSLLPMLEATISRDQSIFKRMKLSLVPSTGGANNFLTIFLNLTQGVQDHEWL